MKARLANDLLHGPKVSIVFFSSKYRDLFHSDGGAEREQPEAEAIIPIVVCDDDEILQDKLDDGATWAFFSSITITQTSSYRTQSEEDMRYLHRFLRRLPGDDLDVIVEVAR